jgi:hypothetical protein
LAPLKPGFPCRDRSSKPKSYEHHTTKPWHSGLNKQQTWKVAAALQTLLSLVLDINQIAMGSPKSQWVTRLRRSIQQGRGTVLSPPGLCTSLPPFSSNHWHTLDSTDRDTGEDAFMSANSS